MQLVQIGKKKLIVIVIVHISLQNQFDLIVNTQIYLKCGCWGSEELFINGRWV